MGEAFTLLNPGPINVHPRVREALANCPDQCHREHEYLDMQARVRDQLVQSFAIADTYEAAILTGSGTAAMEAWIDRDNADLPALQSFILPGGHREAGLFHVLRTVARRSERRVWALIEREDVPPELGTYLNRLSDLLFVWARMANHTHGVPDVPWRKRGA